MVTIEQIDEFRKRTNSSYEDAKYFLEKNNGDVLDAIIDFERTKSGGSSKQKNKRHKEDYEKKVADLIQKGFDTRVVIYDAKATLFSFPIILLIVLIPLWIPVFLLFALLTMIGYRVKLEFIKNENINIGSIFRDINEKTRNSNADKEQKKNKNESSNQKASSSQDSYRYQNAGTNQYNNRETNINKEQAANATQNFDAGKNGNNIVPVQTSIANITETASPEPKAEEKDDEEGFSEYTVE